MVLKQCKPVDYGHGPLRRVCHSREVINGDFGEHDHYRNQGSGSANFVETFPAGACRFGIHSLL